MTFKGDGSPSTPIYTLERVSSYDSSAMIGTRPSGSSPLPRRDRGFGDEDYPTQVGQFGWPDLLLAHSNLKRIVLVEGVMDYLTARLWPPGGFRAGARRTRVGQVVLIVAGLLDDGEIAPRFRRLPRR